MTGRIRLVAALTLGVIVVGGVPLWAWAQGRSQSDPDDKQAGGTKADEKASSTSTAGAQNVCVPKSAVKNVKECPEAAPKRGGGSAPKARTKQPKSQLEEAERKKDKKKHKGPQGPSIELSDTRMLKREDVKQKAWALLQKEARIAERLVSNAAKSNPDRPKYMLRLAQTYFKMKKTLRGRLRSYDQPIYEACRKNKNRARCQKLRRKQEQVRQQIKKLRQQIVATYAKLRRDHPDFKRMDEVLFSLAFELEDMNKNNQAHKIYRILLKEFPNSKFVPNAYLSFAEYYFNKEQMGAALKFYEKVTNIPPEQGNDVYGYALYKSAWAYFNQDNFKKSLASFVDVIEFAQNHPNATDAKNLARQARNELVMPYARVGNPRKAYNFFNRFAKDRKQTLDMVESLAELYYDTGKWSKTKRVYQELMDRAPGSDKLCYWRTRVTNAVLSSGSKAKQVEALKKTLDTWGSFKDQDHPKKRKKQCKRETATMLVSVATDWHREAVGTDTQPGTHDQRTMELASKLYVTLLKEFPKMGQMKFPRLDKRDWPNKYKISYYHAELLWKMEQWKKCGPAFDKVVEMKPKGKYTRDAAYAAVLCYRKLYQQTYKKREHQKQDLEDKEGKAKYEPREFTPLEEGMLKAFQRYICFVPESEDLPTMKYKRARIYYEARHYEEAALLFKDVAYNHQNSDLAEYAANLYLDSLNILGAKKEKPRPACLDEIEESIPELWAPYCKPQSKYDKHADLCGVLEQLRCDVLRKQAESHEDSDDHKAAAYTYVKIAKKYQECGKLDEVLYNAAINFEAANLLGKAIQVRNSLIENYPDSELSKKAVYLIGSNWHAIAVYDRAAKYYERFAKEYPDEEGEDCTKKEKKNDLCPIAHEALKNAVFFRLGLGQSEKAVEDAELFEENYRREMPRETSKVMFAVGSIYKRRENWSKVVEHYRDFARRYRRRAMPHQKLKANLLVAKGYWKLDRREEAERYLDRVVRDWKRNTPEKIQQLDDVSKGQKVKYLREAIDATAEAYFRLAEYEFSEFKDIPFPNYQGSGSLKSVKEWSEDEFKDWVKEKKEALDEAEKDYNKVAEVKVTVEGVEIQSPPWQIAAAARVGEMYHSFVKAFRDAPIPNEVKDKPRLRDIYVGALDKQSKPLVKQAKGSFEFCLQTATNVRWFNKWSRECEKRLHELDPRQYPLAAEMRGEADYTHRTVAKPDTVGLGTEGGGVSAIAEGSQ